MLVCKLEMWPGGAESKARELGRVMIANVGGTQSVGTYEVQIPKSAEYAKRPGIWRRGRVNGFPRLRLGPIDLLLRALIACVGERSPSAVSDLGPRDLADPPNAEATA